jgi:hypothetical protein
MRRSMQNEVGLIGLHRRTLLELREKVCRDRRRGNSECEGGVGLMQQGMNEKEGKKDAKDQSRLGV